MSSDLGVPFQRVGAYLVAVDDEQHALLAEIQANAVKNGVHDVRYVPAAELLAAEPALVPTARGALHSPRESIVCPFTWCAALAENACANGVEIFLDSEVTGLVRESGSSWRVIHTKGEIVTRWVVNAAGLHGDRIAAMAGVCDFTVTPRKGEVYVLDKAVSSIISRIIFPLPTAETKGVLLSPTVHGNVIVQNRHLPGPTAADITADKSDTSCTASGLAQTAQGARKLVPGLDLGATITQYAGLRAVNSKNRFVIEPAAQAPGIFTITGIRSTGLSASPAIAVYAARMLKEAGLKLKPKRRFKSVRAPIRKFAEMTDAERAKAVSADPLYAHVVCRCEHVSEAEVVAAIHRSPAATTLDALKRRIRAGTGRCQGGFCTVRLLEILSRELNVSYDRVTKKGRDSGLLRPRGNL
jgi:glycerol-3-phosphate dehydrogenase